MQPTSITVRGFRDMPEATRRAVLAMATALTDFIRSPKWWVSWYAHKSALPGGDVGFEIHTPWWISGQTWGPDGSQDIICAAVAAPTAEDAKAYILASHDDPPDDLAWRFVEPRPADWQPFCDRFPRADWMRWI